MTCFDVENAIYEKAIFIDSIYVINTISVLIPTIIYIKDILHCIILFPDRTIFNCSPQDYPLNCQLKLDGIINYQIEPGLEEYEKYWEISEDDPYLENDQNCVLWCGYYLDWYNNRRMDKDLFPSSLLDLEMWCRTYFKKNNVSINI